MAIRKSKVDPLPRTPYFEFVNLKSFKNKPSGYRLTKNYLFSGLAQNYFIFRIGTKVKVQNWCLCESQLFVTLDVWVHFKPIISMSFDFVKISSRRKGKWGDILSSEALLLILFCCPVKAVLHRQDFFKVQWINCNLVWLFFVLKKNQSVVCCLNLMST